MLKKLIEESQLSDDPQIAENDLDSLDTDDDYYEKKRKSLETLSIVKQTWSVAEIFGKLKNGIFNLNPSYQRNEVWQKEKKDSFIESLFIGLIVPPIYLLEVRENWETKYEVVDGKQRLSSIRDFISNTNFKLYKKNMDYYDMFDQMSFQNIAEKFPDYINQMMSHAIDCYVISAKTEDSIKYDIFSRINKGAVVLTPDEIRIAIYNSKLISFINDEIINFREKNQKKYNQYFTKQAINSKKDFGRFFRSIAYAYSVEKVGNKISAKNYKSRPKDFINMTLLEFQKKSIFDEEEIKKIIDVTLKSYDFFEKNTDLSNRDYYVDSIVSIYKSIDTSNIEKILKDITSSKEFNETLIKSPATTSNVEKRLNYMSKFIDNHER